MTRRMFRPRPATPLRLRGGTRMTWWRRLSLRGRLVVIGTAGLLVGLGLGGVLLVGLLRTTLYHTVDDRARQTAADVSALVQAQRLSDPVPVVGDPVVQVLDGQGRIRAASLGADRLTPVLHPAELRTALRRTVVVEGSRASTTGTLRVVARTTGPRSDPRTVLVAVPSGAAEATIRAVWRTLLLVYPVLVAVLAALAWRVVGWTLRPVEALRSGAEEITGRGGGRLPVPDARDEVHRLAVTLNGMLDRLERARQRQRAFVGDAAHELRSPLTTLRTQVEVAAHLGERVEPAELLPDISRLTRLVDDLLLLANADERGAGPRRAEPVELTGLLRDVAAAQAAARVRVVVTGRGDPCWAAGDPLALRRLVENLVSNAVRHAASTVTLSAAAGRQPGTAILSVVDDGPGIPAADRERVFQRFTRLDDARSRDAGGAGLGLAIVRELTRAHGGSIELASARTGGPGGSGAAGDRETGLRATVTLPGAPPPETEAERRGHADDGSMTDR